MVALWLPAVSHCALDAATDWLRTDCAQPCSHQASHDHAETDACSLAESGNFTPAPSQAPAPAPLLTVLAHFARFELPPPDPAGLLALPPSSHEHPRDWIPSWTFTHRAAPPARAPCLT